ncbi:hypothetical protein PC121_g19743 [Phytophthora cactorum]|nr:hypothetical protein PC120_g20167 [Phytophthora cactorum]KAG3047982.1 hypothetical protein PC121_g19743 [Phytophthora cactorum]
MEPPDDTATSLSADHLAGVPQFSLPLPLAWADTVGSHPARFPPPQPAPYSPPTQLTAHAASMQVHQAAPSTKKGDKAPANGQPKRIKWTDMIVGELLQLRFSDGGVMALLIGRY